MVCFLPTRANKENIPEAFFRDDPGFGRVGACSCAGFTSSRPASPWTSVHFAMFLHDVALRKVDFSTKMPGA